MIEWFCFGDARTPLLVAMHCDHGQRGQRGS